MRYLRLGIYRNCRFSWLVYMVFHSFRFVFHVFFMVQGGFLWAFMVKGCFFMDPDWLYWFQVGFSWFQVDFSWFQVSFYGFSWFQVILMVFHGSRYLFMVFELPGWFLWFFMVRGGSFFWFFMGFMVPGWFSWFQVGFHGFSRSHFSR